MEIIITNDDMNEFLVLKIYIYSVKGLNYIISMVYIFNINSMLIIDF